MKETCGGDYMNFPGASCTSCPIMIEMCLPIYEKDVYISNNKKKNQILTDCNTSVENECQYYRLQVKRLFRCWANIKF